MQIDDPFSKLTRWKELKDKNTNAILKIEGRTLKVVDLTHCNWAEKAWIRLQRFFGVGDHALRNVAKLLNEGTQPSPEKKEDIRLALDALNARIKKYNQGSFLRKGVEQVSISTKAFFPEPKKPLDQPPLPPPPLIPQTLPKGPLPPPPPPPKPVESSTLSEIGKSFRICKVADDPFCIVRAYAIGLLSTDRTALLTKFLSMQYLSEEDRQRLPDLLLEAKNSAEFLMTNPSSATTLIPIFQQIALNNMTEVLACPQEGTLSRKYKEIIAKSLHTTPEKLSKDQISTFLLSCRSPEMPNPLFQTGLIIRALTAVFNKGATIASEPSRTCCSILGGADGKPEISSLASQSNIVLIQNGQHFDVAIPTVAAASQQDRTLKARQEIEKAFNILPIASDGHCMFRAFAMGLLEAYKNNVDTLREKLTHIEVKEQERIGVIFDSLDTLTRRTPPEDIMDNATYSTAWVAMLRVIAAQKGREIITPLESLLSGAEDSCASDTQHTLAIAYRGEIAQQEGIDSSQVDINTITSYLAKLEALELPGGKGTVNPLFGGALAMRGLALAFGINIGMISLPETERATAIRGTIVSAADEQVELTGPKPPERNPCTVFLLQNGNHFDAALPKPSQLPLQ